MSDATSVPTIEFTNLQAFVLIQAVESAGRQSFANAKALMESYDRLTEFLKAHPPVIPGVNAPPQPAPLATVP